MHLLRERPFAPAGQMPAPAPTPNLRDALARRARVFGTFALDEVTPTLRRSSSGGADTPDIPVIPVRLPLGGSRLLTVDSGGADIGDRMAVFREDVSSLVSDPAPCLALDHERQGLITPAQRLWLTGSLKHALAIVLCHNFRLQGRKPSSDIVL